MSIMKNVKYDQCLQELIGFVDLGGGPDESLGEATEALVFMASGLIGGWKMPIGYLLINGLLIFIQLFIF